MKKSFPGLDGQYYYRLQYFRTAQSSMREVDTSYKVTIAYRTTSSIAEMEGPSRDV